MARELSALIGFLNERFAPKGFNRVNFDEVRRLAGTCPTGCAIAAPENARPVPDLDGFVPRMASQS